MRRMIWMAMHQPELLVIAMEYRDAKNIATQRIVSPIRWLDQQRFLALCLCREEPRQFYLTRCTDVRLVRASEVLMPVVMS